jgi:thioredoxin:protein disulfide reductase
MWARRRLRSAAPNETSTGGVSPRLYALALGVFALGTGGMTATAHADVLSSLEGPLRQALQSGSWISALGIAFAAGVATSLTPCVYPMIAITVSVFGARQSTSKLQAAKLSAAYVLGIAALFTPLGVIAALTGEVFGSYLSNPIVLWGMALIFVALALSMFGLFEIDLPAGLKNRLASVEGSGLRGAFLLGLANSLIAAPCAGPVVGFLLTWVGTTRNTGFGAASFFTYSLGLGLLFFLVGTFSMALPKSGRWLEAIKSVFGIVMLVAALYFVRDLIPVWEQWSEHTARFLLIALALVALGLALGAVHLSFYYAPWTVRLRKSAGIALAVLGLCGLIGYLQALPPGARIDWEEDYEAAQALALATGRPLLVDFGASWCGACEELDRHTFSDASVVREGQRFVPVRIDLSPGKDSPAKQELLRGYKGRGLPLVVLHDRRGKEVSRVTSFVPAARFLELMRAIP